MGKPTTNDIVDKVKERIEAIDDKEDRHYGDDIRRMELQELLSWIVNGEDY